MRLSKYKIWLQEVCKYYDVKEEDIIRKRCLKPEVTVARHTFYWLCWRDGINLYMLATHLGRHRTTIVASIDQGIRNRDRNAESLIYEKITLEENRRIKKVQSEEIRWD